MELWAEEVRREEGGEVRVSGVGAPGSGIRDLGRLELGKGLAGGGPLGALTLPPPPNSYMAAWHREMGEQCGSVAGRSEGGLGL